ncbi:MAG: STAS domain-containing protein [Oscillochloris sp.]|nr:STAS domain-containing protein [Oscillochloris sp.]
MSEISRRFGTYLREQVTANDAQLAEPIVRALTIIADSLSSEDLTQLKTFAGDLGRKRAGEEHTFQSINGLFYELRNYVWNYLTAFCNTTEDWGSADIEAVEGLLHQYRNAFLDGFSMIFQEIERDLALQAEQIEAQRYTIRELSTPILPLYEGILALPLVGALDSYRAAQVMERLLEAISEQQADIVILDITGVPVVDTGVANYLLQTARAAQLVGAEVVLVGIGAEIAQTIVQLGVDLSRIVVYANLQAGISYALSRLGLRITR